MRIERYSWLGIRTKDFESAVDFFENILDLPLKGKTEGFAAFQLASGQLIEVFDAHEAWRDFMTCPVIAFEVDDVNDAKRELEEKGVEFLTDVKTWSDGAQSAYFRGPEGHAFEVWRPATTRPNARDL